MRPHKERQLLPGYQDRAIRCSKRVWRAIIRQQGKMMQKSGDYATCDDAIRVLLGIPSYTLEEEEDDTLN